MTPGSSVGWTGLTLACGGVTEIDTPYAVTAGTDVSNAYLAAQSATSTATLGAGSDLAGLTKYAGVYTVGGDLNLNGTVYLDAQGSANAVFIFQITGGLVVGNGSHVVLLNSANAANVFWQVAGVTAGAALGTTVDFSGTIMAYSSVSVNTGTVVLGRVMALNGQVTLAANTITLPSPLF